MVIVWILIAFAPSNLKFTGWFEHHSCVLYNCINSGGLHCCQTPGLSFKPPEECQRSTPSLPGSTTRERSVGHGIGTAPLRLRPIIATAAVADALRAYCCKAEHQHYQPSREKADTVQGGETAEAAPAGCAHAVTWCRCPPAHTRRMSHTHT